MATTISFDRRFRGPLTSVNGGYAAGTLAAYVSTSEAADAVEVTLRRPPPLARHLRVTVRDSAASLLDGDEVIADARASALTIDPPTVTTAEAEAATARHVRLGSEVFAECFSCGVRSEDDNLAVHAGAVPGREPLQAATWTATEVSVPVLWSAIDCSGAFALKGLGRGDAVLGRMTGRIERMPEQGEPCVVVGWQLGEEGRKLHAGTALLSADGGTLAVSRQVWIAPR